MLNFSFSVKRKITSRLFQDLSFGNYATTKGNGKMRGKKIIYTLLALGVIFTVSLASHAGFRYPARECRYSLDSASEDTIWHPTWYHNALINTSGSDASISCPFTHTSSYDFNYANLWLSDSTATCYLWIMEDNGDSGGNYSRNSISSDGGSWKYQWTTDRETSNHVVSIACSGIGDDEYVYSYEADFN